MNPRRLLVLSGLYFCLTARLFALDPYPAETEAQIERVLSDQAKAWNAGDIDRFMEGYAKVPGLRFASGGTVTRGWQETLDRYKQRYPDRAAMGTLTFSGLETTVLSADAAIVFGRWRLQTDRGEPNGLFTLVCRRTDAGGSWRTILLPPRRQADRPGTPCVRRGQRCWCSGGTCARHHAEPRKPINFLAQRTLYELRGSNEAGSVPPGPGARWVRTRNNVAASRAAERSTAAHFARLWILWVRCLRRR